MTHNETMFGLIENIQIAIEHAHRAIEQHEGENSALDRFTGEYLTRARNEVFTFSSEYNLATLAEARRAAAKGHAQQKERSRDEVTFAEALANAPGPLNDRDVMELAPDE